MNDQLPPRASNHDRDAQIVNALTSIFEICPVESEVAAQVKTLMQGIVATMSVEVVDVEVSQETAEAAFEIGKDFSRVLAALSEIVDADAAARQIDYFNGADKGVLARRLEALAAGRELVAEFIKPITQVEDPNGPFTFAGIEAAAHPDVPEGHIGILNGADAVTVVKVDPEEAERG